MCVVGTQAGPILLCDLVDLKDDPVVNSFKGHQGSVTSLHTHPSAPHIFVSCGQDREVHVYQVKQVRGLYNSIFKTN
jgi:WD40 repeat protein